MCNEEGIRTIQEISIVGNQKVTSKMYVRHTERRGHRESNITAHIEGKLTSGEYVNGWQNKDKNGTVKCQKLSHMIVDVVKILKHCA